MTCTSNKVKLTENSLKIPYLISCNHLIQLNSDGNNDNNNQRHL